VVWTADGRSLTPGYCFGSVLLARPGHYDGPGAGSTVYERLRTGNVFPKR